MTLQYGLGGGLYPLGSSPSHTSGQGPAPKPGLTGWGQVQGASWTTPGQLITPARPAPEGDTGQWGGDEPAPWTWCSWWGAKDSSAGVVRQAWVPGLLDHLLLGPSQASASALGCLQPPLSVFWG